MTSFPNGDLRSADITDLAAMLALEQACFTDDAQSPRSMVHLLKRAHAETRVIDDGDGLAAYAMVLFRRRSAVVRLYSIAVAPAAQGRGLGRRLLVDACQRAQASGYTIMRAEARLSNRASRSLFKASGFVETGCLANYYAGGEDGVRMEKSLAGDVPCF